MKKKIFKEGINPYERAYIGWQDSDIVSLLGIMMGYKESADNLVDKALEKGSNYDIQALDTYIYPILFLYRHSVEINLKIIYLRCNCVLPKGHDILTLWDKVVKDVIEVLSDEEKIKEFEDKIRKIVGRNDIHINKLNISKKTIDEIKGLIQELQGNDTKGDVWRYLVDKKGNLYKTEWQYIDYKNLKETIGYLCDFLESLYYEIEYKLTI